MGSERRALPHQASNPVQR